MSSRPADGDAPRALPRTRSLAWRLTIWYAGAAFATVAATTAYIYATLHSRVLSEADEFVDDHVKIIRSLLGDGGPDDKGLQTQVDLEALEWIYIRIQDERGATIAEPQRMAALLPPKLFPGPDAPGAMLERTFDLSGPESKDYRAIACKASAEDGARANYRLQIAFDTTEKMTLLRTFRDRSIPVLLLAFVICMVLGYQIARRGLRPVQEISRAMLHVRSSTLGERVDAARLPLELSDLAATFNEMLDRLQEAFDRLSRFSADLAHELRTPISNLRGEVEVALGRSRTVTEYRETLGSCLEECVRLSQIIDSLLFLARAENPDTRIHREVVDLARELEAVREYYEAAAAEAQVSFGVDCAPEISASADRTLLRRAIGNLVENALRHTGAGGSILLTAREAGDGVSIGVADTGSGIAPEDLPHVFDRFFRADPSRSAATGGMGLGLAIVKGIAELHGGSVSVESRPSKGTRIVLHLPGRPAPLAANIKLP